MFQCFHMNVWDVGWSGRERERDIHERLLEYEWMIFRFNIVKTEYLHVYPRFLCRQMRWARRSNVYTICFWFMFAILSIEWTRYGCGSGARLDDRGGTDCPYCEHPLGRINPPETSIQGRMVERGLRAGGTQSKTLSIKNRTKWVHLIARDELFI